MPILEQLKQEQQNAHPIYNRCLLQTKYNQLRNKVTPRCNLTYKIPKISQ